MIISAANLHVIEGHMARPRRVHDTDCVENITARTLEDESARMRGTAIGRVAGHASKSNMRPIDFCRALDHGDFTGRIGKEDWLPGGSGTPLHLIESS